MITLQDQLDKASKQLESAQQAVKRLETAGAVSQTPGRRASVTPHKRDRESSITIGTSGDLASQQRIAELECKLAEREQETRRDRGSPGHHLSPDIQLLLWSSLLALQTTNIQPPRTLCGEKQISRETAEHLRAGDDGR